ncbi:putative nucleic acid-binding protein, contains PIN domain [Candidatus Nitrososphaera evergladensis SR1]|uniref:Putative nucleic acid-binding protein, contains PIN domain n=1 Tax=Candidatus Nitrososphaera evergladensis SR1 TaxID=1459636 RepID=A0A075MM69_9ARCH|nr:type II toxin-antitoxin system VapC family toxin [Candidatus Nitrososphaera evergladensis]AIF82353.1 putative nucleic acid-binding protein, contains PIN domain [Candidatus Nitrososphaera evergladensis SR1]
MVCFDTDFLIAFLQKDPDAIKKLEDIQVGDGDTAAITTTVNAAELWKGAYRSKDGQKEAAKVKRLLDLLELITLDRESARMVGELDATTIKSKPIGETDLLIASIALSNKQPLVTKNRKHFERVPGLQVEGW